MDLDEESDHGDESYYESHGVVYDYIDIDLDTDRFDASSYHSDTDDPHRRSANGTGSSTFSSRPPHSSTPGTDPEGYLG